MVVFPHFCPDKREIWHMSPLHGEKPIFGPLNKIITGMAALRTGLPVFYFVVITSAKAQVVGSGQFVCHLLCLSVCLSLCEQDYCKSNEPISLKLDVIIGPTSRKNCSTFGGDPVPGTDSGSLSHFSHHCGMADFSRFISISHTVTGRFSRHSAR